ncbi:hypothetical protein BT93_G0402 [Corymbia citriodora subsp. variegata]|nr:hypothetical protein BT93_G0402 [Corymbia citriodora subsp. variegata]
MEGQNTGSLVIRKVGDCFYPYYVQIWGLPNGCNLRICLSSTILDMISQDYRRVNVHHHVLWLMIYTQRNGDRCAGEYFGYDIHGIGVYRFTNGHCYEVSCHEGLKQGYGMYTLRNGDSKCCEWDSSSLK